MTSTNRSASLKPEIKLRPCTKTDFEKYLFEPYNKDFANGYLESNMDKLLCLDDLSMVELEG